MFSKLWRLLISVLAVGIISLAQAPSADAATNKLGARPAWGACGLVTSQMKLVYAYGEMNLYCGYQDTFGYNHIKYGHKADFATLAAPVGRSWEDLLHFAIDWNRIDPDASRYNPSNGKVCRSRLLYLANNNGAVVWTKIFKIIYSRSNGSIITAFPTSTQCRNKDVGLTGPEPTVITVDE